MGIKMRNNDIQPQAQYISVKNPRRHPPTPEAKAKRERKVIDL
jgi:hypothetical protein